MKIVFYSTTSVRPGGKSSMYYYPKRAQLWDDLAEKYPEHEFAFVSGAGNSILMDVERGEVAAYPERVKCVMLPAGAGAQEAAQAVAELEPDVAIAISTTGTPIDWNFIRDAVVGEMLREKGIRVICQTLFASMAFYDKWRSSMAMRYGNFKVARGIYVNNEQFWEERGVSSMASNVYKEYVLYRVRQLNYPVIIKGTVNAGSLGLNVVNSYEEAEKILTSPENTTDLIVEEMIQGENFGAEIFGANGKYHAMPPLLTSTMAEGFADPMYSVKYGPVTAPHYNVEELQKSLLRMAEEFDFGGGANLDLIFKDGDWYIVEVNPRWSGVTSTAAAAEGRNPFEIYLDSAFGRGEEYSKMENLKRVLNFKTRNLDMETFERLSKRESVKNMMYTVGVRAGQQISYCEIVLGGFDSGEELLNELLAIQAEFPGVVSDEVVANVRAMRESDR